MKNNLTVVPPKVSKLKARDLSNTTPGYKIYEYLLVLNPHEELRNKIMDVKKHFAEKFHSETALYSKPHLTLVN
ncbi:MAG: hypothetical protein ABIU77_21490, partial [Ferruginibacter sp.]